MCRLFTHGTAQDAHGNAMGQNSTASELALSGAMALRWTAFAGKNPKIPNESCSFLYTSSQTFKVTALSPPDTPPLGNPLPENISLHILRDDESNPTIAYKLAHFVSQFIS